jgi:hypothetical protein
LSTCISAQFLCPLQVSSCSISLLCGLLCFSNETLTTLRKAACVTGSPNLCLPHVLFISPWCWGLNAGPHARQILTNKLHPSPFYYFFWDRVSLCSLSFHSFGIVGVHLMLRSSPF